jgi:CubicO group peptidase (beta-lactamase class C family)
MIGRIIALALACVLAPLSARADTLDPATVRTIDAVADDAMRQRHIPSVMIMVARHGQTVFARAYGTRNIHDDVPATVDTVYQYGSLTKQFTAMGIFLLAQDGKVSLDHPIAKYLPEFARKGKITIRHLLVHTSGLANCTEPDDYPFAIAPRLDLTTRWCIDYGVRRPPDFPVGTKASYSNVGHVILARIIEKVGGTSFDTFLRTRILTPARMSEAAPFDYASIVPKMAAGYTWYENRLQRAPFWNLRTVDGAGYLIGTASDLLAWDQALLRGTLLSPKWQKEYFAIGHLANGTPAGVGVENPTGGSAAHYVYGGVALMRQGGVTIYGANGGTFGFLSFNAIVPERDLAVVTLTNLGAIDNSKLTKPILDALLK